MGRGPSTAVRENLVGMQMQVGEEHPGLCLVPVMLQRGKCKVGPGACQMWGPGGGCASRRAAGWKKRACEGLGMCLGKMRSAAVLALLSSLLHPFTLPWEFPQHCFCSRVAKVHNLMKDVSKTFVYLAEWLPGEVGFFPLNAVPSCL